MGRRSAYILVCTIALLGAGVSTAQEPPRFSEPVQLDAPRDVPLKPVQFPATPIDGPSADRPLNPQPNQPPAPNGSTVVPLPPVSTRFLQIEPRTSQGFNVKYMEGTTPEQQIAIITGGIKMLATFLQDGKTTILDVQADELVIWMKGGRIQELVDASGGKQTGNDREIEFYMAGNAILRYGNTRGKLNPDGSPIEDKTLRADKVYYDVAKNKAIAINGELMIYKQGIKEPALVKANELWQLSPSEFRAFQTTLSASRLPSDPGLKLGIDQVDIIQRDAQRRTIFGMPFFNRDSLLEDEESVQTEFKGRGVTTRVLDTPVFFLPYLSGNVNDPLGPLQGVGFRQDKIFGTSIFTTWSMLELLGINRLPNERWDLDLDYLSKRGPGIGTNYKLQSDTFFGSYMPFVTDFRAYGIYDQGNDVLGNPYSNNFQPSAGRGRVTWRHQQEFSDYLSLQAQAVYLSDPNFYEQYYKLEYDNGPNLETFADLKYRNGIGAASLLVQPNFTRDWITETQWLPKASGYWLGQSLFDALTYSAWGSAGYANLQTSEVIPYEYSPTQISGSAGRFDVMQEISAPFNLGPVKLAPYGKLDLAYYTKDIQGDSQGRYVGGGGVRATMPLSRLYSDVESDLFNLNGLYHKMTFGANYYTAYSNVPYTQLRQFDQLNDNAVDYALRAIHPYQQTYVPGLNGFNLTNSPYYDPQNYLIRRLVDTKADTLGTMQALQLDLKQRWQTKRGYPGMEHTVDWLSLDLSGTFFPAANRDNFGQKYGFLEYDANWYTGDRTGFTSSGWFDPYDPGVRYWSVGAFLNRPDRTNFYLGFRSYEPVGSQALTASVQYVFSEKYSFIGTTTYDFGIDQSLNNSLMLSRSGTDMTLSFGISYNAILNNFGVHFEIVPNLLAARSSSRSLSALSPGGVGR